jgi:3-phenylpropionate/cinnamic acid dioxygenase small subunit
MSHAIVSLEDHHRISQFYFHEARLLDERQYQQWLTLLAEDISYTMPTRHTPMLDAARRETETLLNVEQELSQGLEPPLRDDNYFTLSIRVMRSFKLNSWTDNPPARTTRFVSNIEAVPTADGFEVRSNLMLALSRYGADNVIYTARRQDVIRNSEQGFKIAKRIVLLDWNVITAPSAGLFF